MDDQWIERLRCPGTHQPMRMAGPEEIDSLNGRIASGQCMNRAGKKIASPVEAGLLTADGNLFYPVTSGIPILLVEEAIDFTSAKNA